MLAEIRAKKPFNGQRARLTVDGALPNNAVRCDHVEMVHMIAMCLRVLRDALVLQVECSCVLRLIY